MNRLYYGDDLDVLRRHVEDGAVDLTYLDPTDQSGNAGLRRAGPGSARSE